MTTLKKIAAEAGVSVKTVSNILNGHTRGRWPKVATRARQIVEIAERLNYRPNPTARHLRRGRKGKIAVIAAPRLGFFPEGLLYGLTAALLPEQQSLVFHYMEEKISGEELLNQTESDGMLFNGSALSYLADPADPAEQMLGNLPGVMVNFPAAMNAVGVADRRGAETLVTRVARETDRPVAFLSTTPDHWAGGTLFCVRERRLGYQDGQKGVGRELLEFLPERLLVEREIQDFVTASVKALPRPAAVFVQEPWGVGFVAMACRELGLSMPEDVVAMVLDTHDLMGRPQAFPMVVSHIDWKQVGALSFKMLQQRIDQPDRDVPSIMVEFESPRFYLCNDLRRM